MIHKSAVVVMFSSVLLAGCYPGGVKPGAMTCTQPTGAAKQFQVRVEVYEDSLGNEHLIIVEPPQCSKNPTQKGCITVDKGEWAEITFMFLNGRPQNCQGAGLEPWRLESVQMSMTAKDTSGQVTTDVQCDFDTDLNGFVQNPAFSGKYMKIRDWNLKEYDVWYTVTAVNCNNPNQRISSDPWIENKG